MNSSVNMTKSAGNGRFGHIYWRNPVSFLRNEVYLFNLFIEPLLSQGKPSRQSSTFGPNHSSEKAFDGNLNQKEKPGGSCSLTNKETFPFIQVDLLQDAVIKSVRIYNSIGTQRSFNNAPIEVRFNENSANMKICAYIQSITSENQIQTFYCEPNVIGRYVRLVNPNLLLNVCEMQVFGHYR